MTAPLSYHSVDRALDCNARPATLGEQFVLLPRRRIIAVSYGEMRVLKVFMVNGDGNKAIAKVLSITEDTVKSHMKALLRKTGCEHRTALALAITRGELDVRVRER